MYEGPGLYEHYKGGTYLVYGVGIHESRRTRHVIYTSLDSVHQERRMMLSDATFVIRPLNDEDVEDVDREAEPFNKPVRVGSESQAPRFRKVAG